MKLIVAVLFLSLAAQSYAGSYFRSLELNSREVHNNYNVERELNELLSTAVGSHSHWQSTAASMPEASWFKTKVTQRLNNSRILAGMSHLKEKLFKLADEKLDKCKSYNGLELDRNCLGHASGHIMQLIAAVENGNLQRRLVEMNDY